MKKVLIASGVAVLAFAMIASAQGYTFNTNLTVGSTGADVVALQTWLIANGFSIPSVASKAVAAGYFGSQTKAAVVAFQTKNSIPPTGFVGPLTRGSLNAGGTASASASTACPTGMICTPTAPVAVAVACPVGYNCVPQGTVAPTTTTVGSGITTPGVEGILTVTQGPISNTVLNVGQTQVPVLTVRAQAQNSDISIQRITLDLGTNTVIYNKIFTKLYVLDGSTVLATIPLNSSNVVQSGNEYLVTVTGFNDVVTKNSYKDFTVAADLYTAIDTTYRSSAYTIKLSQNQPVRGIDGAGISQYSGDSSIAQTLTINASLTDNSIANVSTDSTSPQTNSVPVTDTTNGQYLKLPVLIFAVGAQNDTLHLHQVWVNIGASQVGNTTGAVTAAYLYQGSTMISSASVSAGVAKFNNIVDGTAGASIPVNTTVPFTVKVDVTGVTSGTLAITPSLDSSAADTVIYNSIDSTINSFNGSAPGFVTTVLGKGPAFALASAPTIAVSGTNSNGTNLSTSTIAATFNVNVQAVGSNVYFSNQASTTAPMFTFKVFNGAGTDVTSQLVSPSSGFIIPSAGVVVAGMPAGSFYIPQQNSATISNVTFQFAGKGSNGQPLTAGPYSVEIAGITSSIDSGHSTTTQSYMDGLSAWRTTGVNP